MDRWRKLAGLASGQFGLVAVWQAQQLGIAKATVSERGREQGWRRVVRGVYLLPGCPLPPLARVRAWTLLLQRPPRPGQPPRRVFASHRSGAFCWNLLDDLVMPVELSVTDGRHPRKRQGLVVHRPGFFDPDTHTTVYRGVPVLTVEPVLCTLAVSSTVAQVARAIARADRLRLTTAGQVEAFLGGVGPFWGRGRVEAALADLRGNGLTHSELEALGRRLLVATGLVPHRRPHSVVDERGNFIAEVDIAFVAERVAVEIDGPWHDDPDRKRADEDRRQRLEELGWVVVRADERRLTEQPGLFVQQVRRALARQARSARSA
jgi:hypothetical protein